MELYDSEKRYYDFWDGEKDEDEYYQTFFQNIIKGLEKAKNLHDLIPFFNTDGHMGDESHCTNIFKIKYAYVWDNEILREIKDERK